MIIRYNLPFSIVDLNVFVCLCVCMLADIFPIGPRAIISCVYPRVFVYATMKLGGVW